MASGLIGRLRSRLVRLPAKLVAMGPGLVEKATVFRTVKEPMSTSSCELEDFIWSYPLAHCHRVV
jgi:hypothetical protein